VRLLHGVISLEMRQSVKNALASTLDDRLD
jgi:hypothetical protein